MLVGISIRNDANGITHREVIVDAHTFPELQRIPNHVSEMGALVDLIFVHARGGFYSYAVSHLSRKSIHDLASPIS
jgi:hypothetical protein